MTNQALAVLDDAHYASLWQFARTMRSIETAADPTATQLASQFVAREARLLEDGGYSTWLSLFADDCVYWVPMSTPIEDPRRSVSYLLDDRRRLEDRVALLDTGWAHAQIPPSQTQRMVGNVEGWFDGSSKINARASMIIWDYRKDVLLHHPVTMIYQLTKAPGGDEWRIGIRIAHRLTSSAAIGNISFIL